MASALTRRTLVVVLVVLGFSTPVLAQDSRPKESESAESAGPDVVTAETEVLAADANDTSAESGPASAKPDSPSAQSDAPTVKPDDRHPLSSALAFARSRSAYIRANIRDYTGRLIKRERIDGKLQGHQFIDVKMRCEQQRDGKLIPMAVMMRYLAPKSVRDRRVLYIEGENNGRMLVRKGGVSLQHVKLRIDPQSAGARRESNYPITDIGFDKMIDRLSALLIEDMEDDPHAENTEVTRFRGAEVGDRVCTRIQVVHPRREEGIDFFKANLFVDDELQLPIRLTVHDWPEKEGEDPPLIEEYTYVNLRVNVGLTDDEFSESRLGFSSRESSRTASSR